jgi:hypothetical protein
MAGILQGQPGGREAAQTQTANEMVAGLKAGNLPLQPRHHPFHDEAAELIVAGVVLLPGRHVEMIEKGESDGRQHVAAEQGKKNGKDLHLLQIEFAIEKKAEPLTLIGGAAQQMDETGILRIRDGVDFELTGPFWFCHAQQFSYGWTRMQTDGLWIIRPVV